MHHIVTSKAHRNMGVDFVKLHSQGFSTLENYDFFVHLRRMLPIMKIYKMYNLENELKYDNFNIGFGSDSLSAKEEILFRNLFMKKIVLETGKNELIGLKKLIDALEKLKKAKGGVVEGLTIIDLEREKQTREFLGYPQSQFEEENNFIQKRLTKFNMASPSDLYRMRYIINNRLSLIDNMLSTHNVSEQLERMALDIYEEDKFLVKENRLDLLEDLIFA